MGDLSPSLGVICGMQSEVRALGGWARDPQIIVAVTGARPERAEAHARRLVTEGCRALLSWGVAGGLDPALEPGDPVAAAEVMTEDGERWALSPELKIAVAAAFPSPGQGAGKEGGAVFLGVNRMVLTIDEKAALRARTGAVALDMESHRVARVAAEAGVPLVTLRAIGDPAGRALPRLVEVALDEDGRPRLGTVVAALLRRPGDIRALLRVKRDTDMALTTLARVADKAIPALLSRLDD